MYFRDSFKLYFSGILLLISFSVCAQRISDKDVVFEGEGAKDRYALTWSMYKTWPEELDGFVVKKRTLNNEWEIIGRKNGFFPRVSDTASLAVVVVGDQEEQRRLAQAREQLLEEKAMALKTRASFKSDIAGKPEAMKYLNAIFMQRYDMALLSGFGMVDASFERKSGTYEYGLFPVIDGEVSQEAIKTLRWEYGTMPEYSFDVDEEFNLVEDDLQLMFFVPDAQYLKQKAVVNFNIIKQQEGNEDEFIAERLNPAKKGDKRVLVCKDENFDKERKAIYVLEAVSTFNNTYHIYDIEIDPKKDLPPDDVSIKFNVKKQPSGFPVLSWDAEGLHEDLVKGYIVQRAAWGVDFENISDTLESSVQTFDDTTLSVQQNYRYRVYLLLAQNFGEERSGMEEFYFEKIPPAPTSLKGKPVKIEGKKYIQFRWNMEDADGVREYYIYVKREGYDDFSRLISLPKIEKQKVLIEVNSFSAKEHVYRVTAVNKLGKETEPSNEVEIILPSKKMRRPYIKEWGDEEGVFYLRWEDHAFRDLDHYDIFVNDEKIAEVPAGEKTWEAAEAAATGKYKVKVQAISQTGVRSEHSPEKTIVVK